MLQEALFVDSIADSVSVRDADDIVDELLEVKSESRRSRNGERMVLGRWLKLALVLSWRRICACAMTTRRTRYSSIRQSRKKRWPLLCHLKKTLSTRNRLDRSGVVLEMYTIAMELVQKMVSLRDFRSSGSRVDISFRAVLSVPLWGGRAWASLPSPGVPDRPPLFQKRAVCRCLRVRSRFSVLAERKRGSCVSLRDTSSSHSVGIYYSPGGTSMLFLASHFFGGATSAVFPASRLL